MAVRNIAVTDTLETFRTEFNNLCANDFGDIANLDNSLSATNLIEAMNETLVAATNTAGFRIEDSSSTQQLIAGGDILRILGTSGQINAVVSATDTLTLSLPSTLTPTAVTATTLTGGSIQLSGNTITATDSTAISFGSENLSTTGTLGSGAITSSGNISGVNITGTGTTHTLGTVEISGNTLRSTDSTRLNVNDTFRANAFDTQNGLLTIDENSSIPRLTSSATGKAITVDAVPLFNSSIEFDGSTAGTNKTTITVTDPTANNTITIPDETGTIISTGSIDAITETMMANDSISSAELKSVVSLIIYNSSGVAAKTIFGAGS